MSIHMLPGVLDQYIVCRRNHGMGLTVGLRFAPQTAWAEGFQDLLVAARTRLFNSASAFTVFYLVFCGCGKVSPCAIDVSLCAIGVH
jgi:hypothetical protein